MYNKKIFVFDFLIPSIRKGLKRLGNRRFIKTGKRSK